MKLVFEEPASITRKSADEFRDTWLPILQEMQKHPGRWVLLVTMNGPRVRNPVGRIRDRLTKAIWLPGKYEFTARSKGEETKLHGRYLGPK